MATSKASIAGDLKLDEIESAIQGEEALATEFVSSAIKQVDGAATNVATFKDIDSVPKHIKLRLATTEAPSGHSVVWSGKMQVANAEKSVVVYRPN